MSDKSSVAKKREDVNWNYNLTTYNKPNKRGNVTIKVSVYIATSLDGYIAHKNNDMVSPLDGSASGQLINRWDFRSCV